MEYLLFVFLTNTTFFSSLGTLRHIAICTFISSTFTGSHLIFLFSSSPYLSIICFVFSTMIFQKSSFRTSFTSFPVTKDSRDLVPGISHQLNFVFLAKSIYLSLHEKIHYHCLISILYVFYVLIVFHGLVRYSLHRFLFEIQRNHLKDSRKVRHRIDQNHYFH